MLACDTTPSLTPGNVIDNGDGTYYMDISACIGSGGSADGFDLYFNNDINILGTTVTEVTSTTGNVATVTVSNGLWLAYFDEYNINGTYFEQGAWGLDCIEFGIIVDENPEGATLCSAGINEDCLGFTQNDVFITCGVIPGPCLPNYSVTDNGSIDGDVFVAGQNCNFAPFNDEIVELTVTCDGNFNFTLTQDAGFWSGESWLTIAAACCSGPIEQVNSFFEETLTIDTYLETGTYYVIVDIYSDGFQPGDYILDITSDADLSLVTTADAGEDASTCEESIVLTGNDPASNETGTWTIIEGEGIITNPSNPNTTITDLQNGINVFEWTIANECATSSAQVTIEVSNDIILALPEIVYCLDDIPLIVAAGAVSDGEWSVMPEFNVSIDDVNSTNTFASISAYGDYVFTYTICDESISQSVSVESIVPELSSESLIYSCLENFSITANVIGDPGYWESEGPFVATFNNIVSLNPTVTVEGYGTYIFTYYGCGTSNSITIDMVGVEPIVSTPNQDVFCLESFDLSAEVDGDPGYWDSEGPGTVVFENQGATNTSVTVDEYGLYQFTYYGCGSNSSISVNMNTLPPVAAGPTEDLYCLEEFDLSAEVDGDPGYWSFEGPGNAIFSNQNSLNTTVNVAEYGTYIFTYNGCGTTSNEVMVNMNSIQPIVFGQDTTECLEIFNLFAEVDGDPGYWSFEGPGNAIFSNPISNETSVEVDAYGVYEFTYNGCGTNSQPFYVNSLSQTPSITTPPDDLIVYCELSSNLVAEVDGDPGYWEYQGPGNAIFSNPNLEETSVEVDTYGVYQFTYHGCGTDSESVAITFSNPEPIITTTIQDCVLTISLEGDVEGDNNSIEWFINSTPEDANATLSSPYELTTELVLSDYGTYEIGLTGCGSTTLTLIDMPAIEPTITADDFVNCSLTTTLFANTLDPSDGGPWETNDAGVIFSNPESIVTEVTVPDFGLYTFFYPGCGTTTYELVGFECPLNFPNVITPNGDGNNDVFIITNLNPEIYTESIFTVYNRWGQIVYNTTQYGLNGVWWDGRTTYDKEIVKDGVYFYILEVFNGATKRKEEYSGEINIFISNSSSSKDNHNDEFE